MTRGPSCPGELLSDPEVPWQATVRGHLLGARGAIPETAQRAELPGLVERALSEVARA